MKRFDIKLGEESFLRPNGHISLALGSFDGMHRGHLSLLNAARGGDGEFGALFFDKSPREILKGEGDVLTSLEDKLRILSCLDAGFAYVLHADEELMETPYKDYEEKILRKINPDKLYFGEDFTYGYKALGTAITLSESFPSEVVPLLGLNGEKVSSSAIRKYLDQGEMEKAVEMLGRPYEITGKVVKGFQNGRRIGFPTANVSMSAPYRLPESGVYGGICYSRGRPFVSIINVGTNPTVGLLGKPIVEAHLHGLSDDIYGETIYCDFLFRIREEKKFPGLEALGEQLSEDMELTLRKLGSE